MVNVGNRVEFDYNGKPRFGTVESIKPALGMFTAKMVDGTYRQFNIKKIGRMYVRDHFSERLIVLA